MRFFWRAEKTELPAYAGWIEHLDDKNRKPGTSAPTLAAAWSGPIDLLGALATNPQLADMTVRQVTVEARSSFDAYGGNVRNHDLVLRAVSANGDPVVVCVEAKAGEPLGATITEQTQAAAKAKQSNPNSNASLRITDLVTRLCQYPLEDDRVQALRYQLLTAWAGTLADSTNAKHAVLALHEFRTDQRPDDKSLVNAAELARFADVVLGCELPSPDGAPWCVRVPDVDEVPAALYVAHAVTDLRRDALAGSGAG